MNKFGKVVHCRLSSGKSDIAVVDEYHIPICPYLTNYLDGSIKQVINTKRAYASQLLFIYRYFNSKKIDIPTRIRNGEYFTGKEYEEFKRYCSYKNYEWMKEEANISSFKRFSDKQLDKMIHASSSSNELVTASTLKLRLYLFANFIEYLHNQHHFTAKPDSQVQYKYSTLIRQIIEDRKSIRDENEKVIDPFQSEIPDVVYRALKECIEPTSPNNPFTLAPRHRNYLIVKLAMEGGLRRGSLIKLKLSDIKDDWDNPRVTITRTPNDPTDPRRDKPSQKTKSHVTAISKSTMKSLVSYVEYVRSTVSLRQHSLT